TRSDRDWSSDVCSSDLSAARVARMHALHSQCLELDLHRLELRYAAARLIEPRAVERLARSIDRHGQLMPCLGVADGEQVVLLDGYRRVAALKRLGRDTDFVERWSCELAQALIT